MVDLYIKKIEKSPRNYLLRRIQHLTIFTTNFRQPTTERSGTIASTTTEALKGSFYDPKNDLIVSYKSKPNGGVSVFYTVPKANNRNFIDR